MHVCPRARRRQEWVARLWTGRKHYIPCGLSMMENPSIRQEDSWIVDKFLISNYTNGGLPIAPSLTDQTVSTIYVPLNDPFAFKWNPLGRVLYTIILCIVVRSFKNLWSATTYQEMTLPKIVKFLNQCFAQLRYPKSVYTAVTVGEFKTLFGYRSRAKHWSKNLTIL